MIIDWKILEYFALIAMHRLLHIAKRKEVKLNLPVKTVVLLLGV
jgi:hypothetical protein